MRKNIIKYIIMLGILVLILCLVCSKNNKKYPKNNQNNQYFAILKAEMIGGNLMILNEPISYMVTVDEEFYIQRKTEELNSIENLDNKKEWFVEYKNILRRYDYILNIPETIYDNFLWRELNILFHVVQAEVGDEYSFEEKINVANVIFNRLKSNTFPSTISENLISDQFSSISDGRYKTVSVSDDTVLACEYAFQFPDTTNGALYFESGDSNVHEKYATYIFEDNAHKFYK